MAGRTRPDAPRRGGRSVQCPRTRDDRLGRLSTDSPGENIEFRWSIPIGFAVLNQKKSSGWRPSSVGACHLLLTLLFLAATLPGTLPRTLAGVPGGIWGGILYSALNLRDRPRSRLGPGWRRPIHRAANVGPSINCDSIVALVCDCDVGFAGGSVGVACNCIGRTEIAWRVSLARNDCAVLDLPLKVNVGFVLKIDEWRVSKEAPVG